MNLIESRLQTALDAAVALITLTIKTVVDRVVDALVMPMGSNKVRRTASS